MGSVPRINYLLANVFLINKNYVKFITLLEKCFKNKLLASFFEFSVQTSTYVIYLVCYVQMKYIACDILIIYFHCLLLLWQAELDTFITVVFNNLITIYMTN